MVLSAVLNVLSTYRGNARAIDKCVEKVSKYKIDFLGVGPYSGSPRSQFFSLLTFQLANNRYPLPFSSLKRRLNFVPDVTASEFGNLIAIISINNLDA